MNKMFLLFFALLFATFTFASAQATLKTHGISPRGVEHNEEDIFTVAYNGLLNVGVGTTMYFVGSDSIAITGTPFSVPTKPGTSAADINVTAVMEDGSMAAEFIPDVAGTYVVQFDHNGGTASLTVNATTYVGNNDLFCESCHNNANYNFKVDAWKTTGHSDMLVRGLDGLASDHYGESCIKCHTTGYDPAAANNGFDDFSFVYPDSATLVSWGSPDGHLFVGAYDKAVTAYPDAMARANIQCEACHGPASAHASLGGNTSSSRMVSDLEVSVCAVCHDEGTHHAFPDQWEHSGEDATEVTGEGFHGGHGIGAFVNSTNRNGCSVCHSGSGFVQWVKEGRPVDANGSPAATAVLPAPTKITCATCHDPHDAATGHQQLRIADTQLGDGTPVTVADYGTGALCMQCHRSRRQASTYASNPDNASSHYGAHHGPEADMLLGVNAPDFGVVLPSSPHAVATLPGETQSNACVTCHMAGELTDAEGNINHVGGHSWNMNDAEGNDHVEACAPCHGDIGSSFDSKKYYINGNADLDGNGTAEGLQLEVKGLLEELALLLPPVGENTVLLNDTNFTVAQFKAGYVYFWIEEDRSLGIHNPAFTIGLLKAAFAELGVVGIIDTPEDGIPQAFELSQNYPNPFNPSTKIDFALPSAGHVNLAVYNTLGQQVASLVNGEMTSGVHTVNFDASNMSSGIYFYQIQVTNKSGTRYQGFKKMILMK